MRKVLTSFVIFGLISSKVDGKAVPQNSLLNLFGLVGSGSNGNWNPLSFLKQIGADATDKNSDPAKHLASIASGFSGLLQDAAKNVEKFGELLSTTKEPPTTKDPLVAGLELLTGIFVNKKPKEDEPKN